MKTTYETHDDFDPFKFESF